MATCLYCRRDIKECINNACLKQEVVNYYLWRDKDGYFYITDYKEIRGDGKVQIDGHGYLEVELVFSSKVKTDLIAHAQKLTFKN